MSGTPERASEVRYLALLLGLTALIFLVRAPFTASFWLDETITAWIVSGSLSSVWSRSIDFQGQSPFYYILVWAVQQMFGAQEVVLRSLSIVCGGLVVVAVARIARRLSTDPATPYVAIALLVGSDSFRTPCSAQGLMLWRFYVHRALCRHCFRCERDTPSVGQRSLVCSWSRRFMHIISSLLSDLCTFVYSLSSVGC